MKEVTIYSDGACRGNPGPGGWGAILMYRHHRREVQGNEKATTNNRMELQAAIGALEMLKEPCRVNFITDSEYVKNGISKWISSWEARGWRTRSKEPVKNVDLWKRLAALTRRHEIHWQWVRGHSGNPENERCDALANEAIDQLQKECAPHQLKNSLHGFQATRS